MKFIKSCALLSVAFAAAVVTSAGAATAVSDLPLKASVLAKPNVIFGMDDSGSMDWEILLDTPSGVAYWDMRGGYEASDRKPRKNSPFPAYSMLFPFGKGLGGSIYDNDRPWGLAAPPIAQMAWLRSNAYNPIYYDSMATYPAWSPAYYGGAMVQFGSASMVAAIAPAAGAPFSPRAAPLHPAVSPTLKVDLTVDFNATNANYYGDGFWFYVEEGMVLPRGSRVQSTAADGSGDPCRGTQAYTLTAAQTVGPGQQCVAAIPYFPATFWHKQASNDPNPCALGFDCVEAPDGSGARLKRYEIRPGTAAFPSGRTYAAEMENFANWFTYYRKRKLMLAGAMGQVLEGASGMRLGNVPFNNHAPVTMMDADGASGASNRFAATAPFYLNAMAPQGTPTHATVKAIANQFETNANVVQFACQRNNMFVVTDGFSNTTSTTVPPYDRALFGAGAPYTVTPTGSLADLALAYYTNPLRPDMAAGKVPLSNATGPSADRNPNLHINTYALTLGVRGNLWPNTVDPYTVAPLWPTPVADDPSMIDDQWHATLNGRGRMYLATKPAETAERIRNALDDMISQTSAQGGVTTSSLNLARSDSRAYVGIYDPAGWVGDLQAKSIDPVTGAVGTTAAWSAAKLLNERTTPRVIATMNGSAKVAFTAGAVGATVNPGGIYGDSTQLVAYLHGDRSLEGSVYKKRKSLMSAVVNTEPVVDRDTGVVYVSSGEGMLHAFDTRGGDAGQELWAYIPGRVLPQIGQTSSRTYSYRTQLDGPLTLAKVDATKTLLIGGLGAAGRGYFAIDVTNPRGLSAGALASKVQWEFPAVGDATRRAQMGQTLGRAVMVRLSATSSAVLVSSGYNNTYDGRGRVWMLNPVDGSVLKEFVTPDGSIASESGLTHISPFGEANGTVRYVYGGDLLGNLWRMDLSNPSAVVPATKITQFLSAAGTPQPVTSAPELMLAEGKRIVLVGTGRLLHLNDFGNSNVQTFYAVADGAAFANARSGLVPRYVNTSGAGSVTGTDFSWATRRGWYMDLPAGEQVNVRPALAYGALVFVTNTAGRTDCSARSRQYVLDALSGRKFIGADFVSAEISDSFNASGPLVGLSGDGSKLIVVIRKGDGNSSEKNIDVAQTIKPAKNSWREVRR